MSIAQNFVSESSSKGAERADGESIDLHTLNVRIFETGLKPGQPQPFLNALVAMATLTIYGETGKTENM
jgi:hypothetical protein